ncbi:DUF202 domain-containing protein [Microbacterium sp. E-13]|uniref:DUF202 domain-containing protein n=1 Tax=Microbacterium sp. E-13 TaxID=3404048 RepID=UPI003CEABAF7
MSGQFDPGLQPERTELAWRRTALALGVGSLVALRLLPSAFLSAWWAMPGVVGLLASASLWVWSRSRAMRISRALRVHGDHAPLPGASLLTTLAAVVTLGGLLAGAVVFTGAL